MADNVTFQNFRDMGGLPCPDGQKIRRWKLFRTPCIVPKTPGGWEFLENCGLDVIIDLRDREEVRYKPDRLPKGCDYINAPVFEEGKYKYILVSRKAKLRVATLFGTKRQRLVKQEKLESYRDMPFSNAYQQIFRCMDQGKTIAFHCSEGKDRTGFAAALIELAFGREQDDILNQYLLSNKYRPRKDRSYMRKLGYSEDFVDDIAYCEETHEELFLMAKSAILARYGSLGEYMREEFDITPERVERWKTFYLEKA